MNNNIYEDKICKFCSNKDKCDKTKYKIKTIFDKTTLYCPEYLYTQTNT